MTADGFLKLAAQSVTAPRDVARLLLSIRLNPEALWTAFALAVVLNGLVFALSAQIMPQASGLPVFLSNPLAFMAMQGASLGATILALTWVGRAMGGTGTVERVAVLLIWLQALRVLVQASLLLILPLSEALGALVQFAASALGVWIVVHFIDEAHELNNLLKSALALVFGVLGMALALSLILSLMGFGPQGLTNV